MLGEKRKKSTMCRIGIDIKDLDLSKLGAVSDKSVVAFSKHLCGAATDIMLKCLVNFKNAKREKTEANPVIGIVVALCCHQVCRHYMYPDHDYLRDLDISEPDFAHICAMSSWFVCGQRPPRQYSPSCNSKQVDRIDHKNVNMEEEHAPMDEAELGEAIAYVVHITHDVEFDFANP
jgi:tRNA:m4X modification enzyme